MMHGNVITQVTIHDQGEVSYDQCVNFETFITKIFSLHYDSIYTAYQEMTASWCANFK